MVVVSSAVHDDNPEVVAARKKGIPVVPRAEMLAELMRLKYGIAIAGTHGKTTTTSLVATILASAGFDPTIIIGGKVNNFGTNARLGRGEFLVAEADESDRSFLKLTPTIAVVTNIDPEHMENYRDFEHVRETYVSFVNKVPFYGVVVICSDHPETRNLRGKIERRVITYGIKEGDFTAGEINHKDGVLQFEVFFRGKLLGAATLATPGRHNVQNALASIAVASELEIPFAKIKKGLAKFKGIERRFQILLKKKGLPMVISDYAHHPREIEAVIKSARDGWPLRRVVCVIQPHRYTRLSSLFGDFVRTLAEPDVVVILPVYPAGEPPIEGVSGNKLYQDLLAARARSRPTMYFEDVRELFKGVRKTALEDDIILFLGAGDIWKTAKEFIKQI